MARTTLPSGIEIFYRDHGQGTPLLLIAGTASDHTFWGMQVQEYRERFRTIAFDPRGTGRSSRPEEVESYTSRALSEDALGLLDALEVESAHVAGLSLGSAVAQELALAHPERVRSLQLHGTWGRGDGPFLEAVAALEGPATEGWGPFFAASTEWTYSQDFRAGKELAILERAALALNPHPPDPAGILGHLHADRTHASLDRLDAIRCPTLVTVGELDALTPPHLGREVAERIPGAEMHVFLGPRASHLANLEMAEEFNRVTLEWLVGRERERGDDRANP
jgi:pimeloyl-ACP methyl ester carboxylesterase